MRLSSLDRAQETDLVSIWWRQREVRRHWPLFQLSVFFFSVYSLRTPPCCHPHVHPCSHPHLVGRCYFHAGESMWLDSGKCARKNLVVVTTFKRCRPSVHTYGSLIKAYSSLKRIDGCWELWSEMVDYRAMVPNEITIGCMLDALVCNRQVEQAVALLQRWKERGTA